jgi:serine/threonine-protein kinase
MSSPRERPDGSTDEVPRPGEILDKKYRVLEGLGAGGMGVVLLVEHMELGQRMAVKMMRPGAVHDAGAVTRFLREARAAAGLESEHVVRIFDVGTLESGVPYMVMELLRGEDLSRVLLANGQLPISDAVDYVLQACHAIAEAHGLGIVHRDLKPSNIFLTRRSDGSPLIKVLDFGISKALTDASPDEAPTSLTSTSTVMGSPLYMSPEQIRNSRQVDARTDIWSLGVILHELLTGVPAFQADTVPGICAAIAADEPILLSSLRDDVPHEIETVVVRCLEKNITQRFQSVSELMNALRGFAPANSRVPPMVALASTLPEAGSSPGGSPASPVRSRGGRVVMSAPDGPPFRSSRPSGRPESRRGAIASGGAVAISAQTHPSATRAVSRFRLPLIVGTVVLGGVAAGWTLASLRQEGRDSAPPEASAASLDRGEAPASFVLVIDSEPPGAAVVEGSQKLGTTPARISVENESARGNPRKLSVERPGFLPYSIVQGPSGHDVHVFAALEPTAQAPPAPSARPPTPPMSRPAKPLKPSLPAAVVSAEPPPVSAKPAPPATPDIRLQR